MVAEVKGLCSPPLGPAALLTPGRLGADRPPPGTWEHLANAAFVIYKNINDSSLSPFLVGHCPGDHHGLVLMCLTHDHREAKTVPSRGLNKQRKSMAELPRPSLETLVTLHGAKGLESRRQIQKENHQDEANEQMGR